jgi:hypothetical protein
MHYVRFETHSSENIEVSMILQKNRQAIEQDKILDKPCVLNFLLYSKSDCRQETINNVTKSYKR